MVCIAVVAVLIGLLIVGIAHSRRTATRTQCLSHVSSCAAAIGLYAADHQDTFPVFARETLDRNAYDNGSTAIPYMGQSLWWPIAARSYIGGRTLEPVQLCPGDPVYRTAFGSSSGYTEITSNRDPKFVFASAYAMMKGAYSDPAMWTESGDYNDLALFRGVRTSETMFPSAKGLLIEYRPFHERRTSYGDMDDQKSLSIRHSDDPAVRYGTAFIDGSARHYRFDELLPGVAPRNYTVERIVAILDTRDGVRGRDR